MGNATGRKYATRAALVTIPTRRASEGTGGVTVLALASVPRLRVGLMWPGSAVPVSMRSLGTDRSLGKFPPARRLK